MRQERDDLAVETRALRVARRTVEEDLVHEPLRHGRRRGGTASRVVAPFLVAGARLDREENACVVRDVELPVRDHRRKLEQLPRAKRPLHAERRAEVEPGHRLHALVVVAVRRPDDLRRPLHRRFRLRRHELLARRAADVAPFVPLVEDVARDRPSTEQENQRRGYEGFPHLGRDAVERREAVHQQFAAVTGHGHVVAVVEGHQSPTGARVEAVRAVARVREVDDSRDDGRRTRDRTPARVAPDDAAARRGDAVENAVEGAEVHTPGPDCRRGVDVRAGIDRPEVPPVDRERRQGVARRRRHEDAPVRDGGRSVDAAADRGDPAHAGPSAESAQIRPP